MVPLDHQVVCRAVAPYFKFNGNLIWRCGRVAWNAGRDNLGERQEVVPGWNLPHILDYRVVSCRRCRDYSFAVRVRDSLLAKKMDAYMCEMISANIIELDHTVVNAPLFPIWKDKQAGTIRPIYD